MDKRVRWALGAFLAVVIITETPLVFTLFSIFILGMVPGTSVVVPAWLLLVINPLLCLGIIWVVRAHHLFTPIDTPLKPTATTRTAKKARQARTKKSTTATKRRASRAAA